MRNTLPIYLVVPSIEIYSPPEPLLVRLLAGPEHLAFAAFGQLLRDALRDDARKQHDYENTDER